MKYQTLFIIHLAEGASKAMLLFMTDIVMAVTINSGKWLICGIIMIYLSKINSEFGTKNLC
jgi:hypothetical protein